jgi:hypothetical protein
LVVRGMWTSERSEFGGSEQPVAIMDTVDVAQPSEREIKPRIGPVPPILV